MAFLDIEKVINTETIGSRFKLVHLAGLRAKELNKPKEETVSPNIKEGEKVTSKALKDIVSNSIIFTEISYIKNNSEQPKQDEEKGE